MRRNGWFVLVVGCVSSNAALAGESFEGNTFYLGDLHAHTSVSGDASSAEDGCSGCGWQSDIIQTAKDNGLDFVAFTDHVNGTASTGLPQASTTDYASLTATVLAADEPGVFVTIPAAEVFFAKQNTKYGHKTLLMFGSNTQLASLTESELWPSGNVGYATLSGCSQIVSWMNTLTTNRGDAILIPHHPTAITPMATDWSCHSNTYEPAVEGYSNHGSGWVYHDSYDTNIHQEKTTGSVTAALDTYGLRMGFVAATDRHDTRPGETCAPDAKTGNAYGGGVTIAMLSDTTEFNRTNLGNAIKGRHTIASSGPLIPVGVHWMSGGADLGGLGDDIGVPSGQSLQVEIHIPDTWADIITQVQLVSSGRAYTALAETGPGVWSATVASGSVPTYFYVDVELDGDGYWGTGACSDGGSNTLEHLWVSPSWISRVATDLDHDGVAYLDGDCDDGDASIHPGATDTPYDGIDSDCDHADDFDVDRDGYELADDCDDTNAAVHVGAVETWYDGVDQDCALDDDYDQDADSFEVDVDCDDTDPAVFPTAVETWYDGVDEDCDGADDFDQDADTYILGLDCDDEDATVFPGAPEDPTDGVDSDCDGLSEFPDDDADGFPADVDCDDTNPLVYPFAAEVWYDGLDQNCDERDDFDQDGDGADASAYGGTDCDDTNAAVKPGATEVWYDGVDQNCDGRNDDDQDGDTLTASATGGTDCNDMDAAVKPGATEVWYDGVDQDCDGRNDYDQDGDTLTASAYGGTDCNDTNAAVKPGATEVWYDGVDQNCDGRNDYDQDGDAYTSSAYGGTDCNDTNAAVKPGATDAWYDGVDQNCDGRNDYDQDGDTYPSSAYGGTDCNDTQSRIKPGALEVWYDGVDQNCDGRNDYDKDMDGYPSSSYGGTDCNDNNRAVYPGRGC